MFHERPGWSTPLSEVEISQDAAVYEAAGFHALAQLAQAAASKLVDRFPSIAKEPWTSHFTREADLNAYQGSVPPAEILELIKTVRRQGATRVYFRIARNGEALVLAIVPTSEGDKRVRLAQWAPEGQCTKLSEIKHANRVAMTFMGVLLALTFVLGGTSVVKLLTGSGDANWYNLAAFVTLYSMAFGILIRRRLISKSKQARVVMP